MLGKNTINLMTTLQIRIDEKTKRNAKRVLDRLGIEMSAAIKIYLKQIELIKGLPFPVITTNGFTPEQEARLIAESNKTLRDYKTGKTKGYASTKELMQNLLA
ncbi:hypothetical protein A3D69_01355 [Candidatus Uhrbacteria bacterium RIFCSPHIGHO2_02_FULL_54_11]|uniref:Toxin-antitoxin system, antitoxin component, ribbon-helix-helix fold protein n=1 Tax=Candidatus Uhrbacteria bacterium GW2011_GWC2_53_7 TaxID=1618986 RepID=A0A0G1Y1I0_9BACT|nr:MAG: Toxin-antitoxin system, antitoxin component, ribbon-helix-helix fold protein [Candidatus Uhrbacteria bacterium GW2011_GWC2_53_7]OGL72230.1 MAG: hypothetical protein A3D69_01355 [Candidatus Uhrbacteria bacterium RIFCSPHIGHO2_02_FULL_54_11]